MSDVYFRNTEKQTLEQRNSSIAVEQCIHKVTSEITGILEYYWHHCPDLLDFLSGFMDKQPNVCFVPFGAKGKVSWQ